MLLTSEDDRFWPIVLKKSASLLLARAQESCLHEPVPAQEGEAGTVISFAKRRRLSQTRPPAAASRLLSATSSRLRDRRSARDPRRTRFCHPKGKVLFDTYKRTGGGAGDFNAIKFLKVAAS
jgi:hypothetical protein